MRVLLRVFAGLAGALLLARCSAAPFESFDAGPDASPDAPVGLPGPDAAADAAPDVVEELGQVDAELDAAPEATVDAAPDVTQVPDAGVDAALGGDFCPIFGKLHCTNGVEFHAHAPDGGTDYLCGSLTPRCPTGDVCWALNSQNQPVYGVCP